MSLRRDLDGRIVGATTARILFAFWTIGVSLGRPLVDICESSCTSAYFNRIGWFVMRVAPRGETATVTAWAPMWLPRRPSV
jgi:hypothetical protein